MKKEIKKEPLLDCVSAMGIIKIHRRSKGVLYSLYADEEKSLKEWKELCKKHKLL